ncbi:RCC1 domain-containing protein [Lysobacter niabensis]|uniref:RCC1 domain-containing protein n=1 Tax=Agrilutibacter niabensis TaxID=380628 RepID=UPI0036073D6A
MSTNATSTIAIAAPTDRAGVRRARLRTWCGVVATCLLLCSAAAFAGKTRVVAWGGEVGNRALDIPYSLDDAVAIAVPYVLRANGEVIEIGTMPPVVRARNARAIAAAGSCLLILHRNGAVAARGACHSPVPAGLSGVVAIAAGGHFGLALTSSGRVVAWGDNSSGQTDVPTGLRNVVAIAAGRNHALALRSNGQVVAWGGNIDGELDIPPGLANVVAIDVGNAYNLALKSDGTVVAWGDVFDNPRPVPLDLPPARALGAGEWRQAAVVLRDGTIREWGFQEGKSVPPGLRNVVRLSMGFAVNFALVDRPITPLEAIADMRVDLDALLAIEDADRNALNAYLDLAAWAVRANRAPLACTAMRSFAALAASPGVIPYPDRVLYLAAQTRDVLRLMGCGHWRGG